MRLLTGVITAVLLAVQPGIIQSGMAQSATGQGLVGAWRLNPARSETAGLPVAPDSVIHVSQQSDSSITIWTGQGGEGGAAVITRFPLDGKLEKREVGGVPQSLSGKWEGSTLLTTLVVGGSQKYTVTERWRQSRDGNTLTISRTIVRPSGDREFVLIYERPNREVSVQEDRAVEPAGQAASSSSSSSSSAPFSSASSSSTPSSSTPSSSTPSPSSESTRSTTVARGPMILRPSRVPPASPAAVVEEPDYVIESGTHILLRLTNAVNTKHSRPGDKVYLETAAPVFVDQHMVIPRGSYVIGTITESERAGRVKGKSLLNIRFESLTLPSGLARNFNSRAGSVEGRGNVDRKEGRIEGEGNKSGDAATIGKTTAAGAGVGSIAGAATGHLGMGAGIGAAAGAAAGLAGVLLSRGQDVVLPAGTTVEMVLDRELRYTPGELR